MSVLFIIITVLSFFTTQPTYAHVLETDGTIGAVLHIQPDDNPTVGVDTTYQLAFTDTSRQFQRENCDCGVAIKKGDRVVATQTLASTNHYRFQEAGVYTLIATGTARDGSFNNFRLQYSVRVHTDKQLETQPFPITLGIGFVLLTILLLLAAVKVDGMMER